MTATLRTRTRLQVRIGNTKRCSDCGQYKTLDLFFNATKSVDGKHSYCKECKRERQWAGMLKTKFNMTTEDYQDMLETQGGRCAICPAIEPGSGNGGGYGRWYVDHNHETDEVRGLLCASCNLGIGIFKDDPNRLRDAADYLEN